MDSVTYRGDGMKYQDLTGKAPLNGVTEKRWKKFTEGPLIKTWGWLIEHYHQPKWCRYPDAISPLGCWSLISWPWEMTRERCSSCELYKDERRQV